MTAVIVLLAVLVVLETVTATVLVLKALDPKTDVAKTAAQAENTGADERRPGSIDEGFENIMAFSVQGKTGFEQDE